MSGAPRPCRPRHRHPLFTGTRGAQLSGEFSLNRLEKYGFTEKNCLFLGDPNELEDVPAAGRTQPAPEHHRPLRRRSRPPPHPAPPVPAIPGQHL